jgi:hypothetical protein
MYTDWQNYVFKMSDQQRAQQRRPRESNFWSIIVLKSSEIQKYQKNPTLEELQNSWTSRLIAGHEQKTKQFPSRLSNHKLNF